MPDSVPPIGGLLETSLYAADAQATAAFYRELFGFRILLDSPRLVALEAAPGREVLLVFQRGATSADLVDRRGTIPGHDGAGRLHLAFSIPADGLAAWRVRLAERDLPLAGEYVWPRGGTSLYFRDPDGTIVELATPGLWW